MKEKYNLYNIHLFFTKDAEAKATTVQAQLDESTGKIAHLQDELKLAERYNGELMT